MFKVSISQLSEAYGLTPEALRYYEEKGLITPSRDQCSGFRRFSIPDVQRLGVIKSLQRQGFSLDEIRKLLTGCPKDEVHALFLQKQAQLQSRLLLLKALCGRTALSADLLTDRSLMVPRLAAGTACYVVDFASSEALWTALPDSSLLKALISALPLSSYCSILPLKRLTGGSAPLRVGIAAPVEYSSAIAADFSKMHMLAGPRTVRTLFELNPPETKSLLPVEALALDFIRSHQLTPVCAGYTRQYLWFVDEHGTAHHFAELILPVSDCTL